MKILFIGSRLFDDVAWYTKKLGIESILTESNENAPNLDFADKKYIVPRGMEEPINIAIKEDVDAVIPLIGIDPPLLDVGHMKEKLEKENNIPVIASSYNTASLAANKYKTKETLRKNNINTPEFRKLEHDYNLDELEKELPLVFKTPDGQGGVGVKVALTRDDITEFIKGKDNIFIEDFVEGLEVSIEVLRWNNKQVAITPVYKGDTTLEGTHPLSKIKQAPLNIQGIDNKKHNNQIRTLAEKLAKTVKFEGTMDIDILHDKNNKENYVIELNTRPSGTRYMTAATSNIYPLCQLVDMAIGNWTPEQVKKDMKNYYATELPIGDFPENKKIPEIKAYDDENSYIVHGPKHYQRLTVRANTKENLNNMVYDLVPDYAEKNNINFV